MERRTFITHALAALGAGSLLPVGAPMECLHLPLRGHRGWLLKVEVFFAADFERSPFDHEPLRFAIVAACLEDAWDHLDAFYPHHEVGQPILPNSAWKRSVQAAWEVPLRI